MAGITSKTIHDIFQSMEYGPSSSSTATAQVKTKKNIYLLHKSRDNGCIRLSSSKPHTFEVNLLEINNILLEFHPCNDLTSLSRHVSHHALDNRIYVCWLLPCEVYYGN